MDYVNGTDSNASVGNGDSFATRRKRINNFVAAATAPGDTIRIMGSPNPTSLGVTGKWDGTKDISTFGIGSSTNTTPIVLTVSGHNLITGDAALVAGHTTNTNANGAWIVSISGNNITLLYPNGSNSVGNGVGSGGTITRIRNRAVILASSVTKNIAVTGGQGDKTNWTASANVTCTVLTADRRQGVSCQNIDIAVGFTTGMAAYWPLVGATDFSAYTQISFWIKQTSGTIGAAGACTLTLCSDNAGATPVNTVNIPNIGVLNRWYPVTVDTGGALGASIQSIAFNVVTNNGAQIFQIDNVIACKDSTVADSLSLQSLIGKNISTDTFYGIQSIDNTLVMLDQETNTLPGNQRGFFGTTETVTTYKRETIKTIVAPTNTILFTFQEAGSVDQFITYSGGWNTVDMSTQSAETWFDGSCGQGTAFFANGNSWIAMNNIAVVRYWIGISSIGNYWNLSIVAANNCLRQGFFSSVTDSSHLDIKAVCNNSYDTSITFGSYNTGSIGRINGNEGNAISLGSFNHLSINSINGNSGSALFIASQLSNDCTVGQIISNGNYGIFATGTVDCIVRGTTISGHGAASVYVNSATQKLFLFGCTLSDSVKVDKPGAGLYGMTTGVYSQNEGGIAGNHIDYFPNGTITSETSVRHTASGISWKLSPTTSTYVSSLAPFYMSIAKVACGANTLVTASLWMRRTNTGLTAMLKCRGGQIASVPNDVSTNMTAIADTWEQVTITFTPTEIGIVEIITECWGGTTYSLYVDDFSISQA